MVSMSSLESFAATDYNIVQLVDLSSGIVSMYGDSSIGGGKISAAFFNDTVGKKLGIRLNVNAYDSRFDPAVIASLWPSVLSKDHPIGVITQGGDAVAGLMGRLPADKVPGSHLMGALSAAWKPNMWLFFGRPLAVHDFASFLQWARSSLITDRPVKVAIFATSVPSAEDIAKTAKKYIETVLVPAKKAELVALEFAPPQAVDITPQMQKISSAKPDFIWVGPNPPSIMVLVLKHLKSVNLNIPLVFGVGAALDDIMGTGLPLQQLEGCYDVISYMPAMENMDWPAGKIYTQYKDQIHKKTPWNSMTVVSLGASMLLYRAVERAAASTGPDKITGEAVYAALTSGKTFTSDELLGVVKEAKFTPTENINLFGGCNVTTIKGGKRVRINKEWIPIPADVPR
jgi:branched-chain amino acid transport system substrate-binding protein